MRSQPNRDYVSNDVVMTPMPLACKLVDALDIAGSVLEPCCGGGSFVFALATTTYDIQIQTCEITEGRDFFDWTGHVDWIVTNPPWSQFRPFLKHALEVADNVAFLVTVNHWWTKARVKLVRDAGFGYKRLILVDTPPEFPATGFQLGMMHVQKGWNGPLEIR